MDVQLTVNGEATLLDVEPRRTLADALREDLGLTGTTVGCAQGVCGSCTVLVDGESARSCLLLGVQAEGADVVTVEGMSTGAALHPVQQAFLDEQAAQCGFCVTGIVMTAAALLERDPRPGEEQVAEALDRHLCRCGAQQRMIRAVVKAGEGPADGVCDG